MKIYFLLSLFLFVILTFTKTNHKISSQLNHNIDIKEIHGLIDDCCCDAESVDKFNNDNIHYMLEQLTTEIRFFKYFKVDLYKTCPFWAEQYLCSIKEGGGCGACICEENEIPSSIKESDLKEALDQVDYGISSQYLAKWEDKENDLWIKLSNQGKDMVYLDLSKNPERYTGYEGYNASRIWHAIYMENCFHPKSEKDSLCFEERVFYRLISGMHGSITAHIAEKYFKDGRWQPNVEMYARNLGAWPERVKNIYFTYLFLIRAVKKAQNQILKFDYHTGNKTEEGYGTLLLQNLIAEPLYCGPTFDETKMFSNPESYKLRQEFKEKFRNISEIMDCVTCETCKIHAKLQIFGIGTALKILTSRDIQSLDLQRNEIVALINTLFKFSESITIHHLMRIRLHTEMHEKEHNRTVTNNKDNEINHKNSVLFLSGILISLFVIIYSFFIIKSKTWVKKKHESSKTNKTKQKKN